MSKRRMRECDELWAVGFGLEGERLLVHVDGGGRMMVVVIGGELVPLAGPVQR